MDLYDKISADLSRKLTLKYSTSFGSASRLHNPAVRPHIYNIYGWGRIGDEIVDTYRGQNAQEILEKYRADTYQAIQDGFSPNPIIQAFALTAGAFGIGKDLIDPFFVSMNMDLDPPKKFTKKQFETYIHGSAQVIGLMCLKVYVFDDPQEFKRLKSGAESLGAAFQKINFLRDFSYDTKVLKRHYFPQIEGANLTEKAKRVIINDIRHDLTHAVPAIDQLPKNAYAAVMVSTKYYYELLNRLESTPAKIIASERIRIPDWRKAQILAYATATKQLKRNPAESAR